MRTAVERRLGAAAARLSEAIIQIVNLGRYPRPSDRGAEDNARAIAELGSISMRVLCGEFHDLRSGRVLPKGDLVTALRKVHSSPLCDDEIATLITRIVAGEFTEDDAEQRRYASRFGTMAPSSEPELAPAAPIHLSSREARAHVWLYRYVEVYGRGPRNSELAEGLGIPTMEVSETMRRLVKKGAAVKLAGERGWRPTRAP